MKRMLLLLLITLCWPLISFAKFIVIADHRITPLPLPGTTIWYPTALKHGGCNRLPFILLLQSLAKGAPSLNWLAQGIAANGYIVAITHQKPQNVNALITRLLHSKIQPYTNPNAIGIISNAEFGAAGIELAGGKINAQAMAWLRNKPNLLNKILLAQHDQRAKAVLLISPGFAWAFGHNTLKMIKIPLFIIYGNQEPYTQTLHAEYYADNIPTAGLVVLPNTKLSASLANPAVEVANLPRLTIPLTKQQLILRMAVAFFGRSLPNFSTAQVCTR